MNRESQLLLGRFLMNVITCIPCKVGKHCEKVISLTRLFLFMAKFELISVSILLLGHLHIKCRNTTTRLLGEVSLGFY